ncbi:MAG: hypothetical protein AAF547_07050 [Actinomycetota bacterium]
MEQRPKPAEQGDLCGSWRAHPLDLDLQRVGADADLDDRHWETVPVPGHWGENPAFADHDGPLLYRRRFEHRPPDGDDRLWLRFDGVLSGAEIWLDGRYVGDTTSYFAPQRFEVTDALRAEQDHLLAVEVSCRTPDPDLPRSSLTGSIQAGHLAPTGNPGGIWRPVQIERTGPIAIRHGRLLCTSAEPERATLQLRLVLDVEEGAEVRIDTSVVGPDGGAGGGSEDHSLASGENRIEWTVPIDGPRLWWPAALGEQPRYDVSVVVRSADGAVSDRRSWRTGLRRVTVDDFIWRVNGTKLFAKGIVAGPADRFLDRVSAADLARDIRAVRDAGLDLVRLHGHIGRTELYDEADRLGVLVWQDLPLVGRYSSKVRSATRTMIREAVDHLGHHPSVGLWCGRGRMGPGAVTVGAPEDGPGTIARRGLASGTRIGRDLAPGWNRSVFDRVVARELRNADTTRPIVTRSGGPPGPADPAGTDAHLWLGWSAGLAEQLPAVLRRWPRLAVFPGGIGSQSAVDSIDRPDGEDPAPTWPGASIGSFDRYLPHSAYGDGRAWAAATRAYQGDVLRTHIEAIRKLKYRPAGGFLVTALADVDAAGGFGVLTADRSPKPAYDILVDACRPVIVVAEPPPAVLVPGEDIRLPVHVVSDLRDPLAGARVTARVRGDGWERPTVWEGDLPADRCQWVGDLRFTVPERPQQLSIDLDLQCGELAVSNRYRSVVIPSSEALGRG